MNFSHVSILSFILILLSCQGSVDDKPLISDEDNPLKGALLLTNFTSFEGLKREIDIEYKEGGNPMVTVSHISNGVSVKSILASGVSEDAFLKAKSGNLWDRFKLGLSAPFAVIYRKDLERIFSLARRMYHILGEGDVAFYDIAEQMVSNISVEDRALMRAEDLSEKGYLNTFNHITAQAFMTTLFSEKLADFTADVHERKRLPELMTGKFTQEQIADLYNGPVDNYIDIINNEWGQELGKILKKKYHIDQNTNWTPELLSNYINNIQSGFSWVFKISFEPFKATDEVIVRFSYKMNIVLKDLSRFKKDNLFNDYLED